MHPREYIEPFEKAGLVVKELIGRRVRYWGGNDPLRPLLFALMDELQWQADPLRDPCEMVMRICDAEAEQRKRYNPPKPPEIRP